MRALSTAASRRGLEPTISSASACSMPAMVALNSSSARPHFGSSADAVLPASIFVEPSARHQLLEREHLLDRGKVAGDRADALGRRPPSPWRRWRRRLPPCRRPQPAVLADIRPIEPLRAQAVDHMQRVLSEIHSSFTSSLMRGRMRMTSRPRAVDADGRADARPSRRWTRSSTAPTAAPRTHMASRSTRRPGRDRRRCPAAPRSCACSR